LNHSQFASDDPKRESQRDGRSLCVAQTHVSLDFVEEVPSTPHKLRVGELRSTRHERAMKVESSVRTTEALPGEAGAQRATFTTVPVRMANSRAWANEAR
jgi:hypothetical protein